MSAPAGVVFDVDGTLVDSEQEGHRIAFNQAFAEAGLPYRWDRAAYRELLRVAGGRERIQHFLAGEDVGETEAAAMAADLLDRFPDSSEAELMQAESGRQ